MQTCVSPIERLEHRLLLSTYLVTSGADAGPGTLRQAILDANASPGADAIAFDVSGPIRPTSLLPNITDGVVIDGTTQPSATSFAPVVLDGQNATRTGLRLTGGTGSAIRGLTIVGFRDYGIQVASGSDGVNIEGNSIGLQGDAKAANGVGVFIFGAGFCHIGGPDPAQRNVISGNADGVRIDTPMNIVEGNYIGTLADGTPDTRVGNTNTGVLVTSGGSEVGRNIIRNNLVWGNATGVRLEGPGNYVRGNSIRFNSVGVAVSNADRNEIGGDVPADGNLFTSNRRDGMFLSNADDTLVRYNSFGTREPDRFGVGNGDNGISLGGPVGSSRTRILDNFIGYNDKYGLSISIGTDNAILSNVLESNGLLAIELGGDGVQTPNDPGDADVGANRLQNFPVLSAAASDGTATTVSGTLDTLPGSTYRVEFFSSLQRPFDAFPAVSVLGSVETTPDAFGAATFTATLPPVEPGAVITATATRLIAGGGGETSELSAGVPVTDTGLHVEAVFARGSAWSAAFKAYLAEVGLGDATLGCRVTDVDTLTWVNIDQIVLRFNHEIPERALPARVTIDGVRADYFATPSVLDPRTILLTLDGPLGADRLRITDDALGGSPDVRFNVLPGDVDRSDAVLANDVSEVKKKFFSTTTNPRTGDAAYSMFHDVNGSGSILADDFSEVKRRFFSTLPAAVPTVVAASDVRLAERVADLVL